MEQYQGTYTHCLSWVDNSHRFLHSAIGSTVPSRLTKTSSKEKVFFIYVVGRDIRNADLDDSEAGMHVLTEFENRYHRHDFRKCLGTEIILTDHLDTFCEDESLLATPAESRGRRTT